MTCGKKHCQNAPTEATRVDHAEVEGRPLCDHPGCDQRVVGDGTRCVDGHVQGVVAAVRPPEELTGLLDLASMVDEMGLGEFIRRSREKAQQYAEGTVGDDDDPVAYQHAGVACVRDLLEDIDGLDEYTESFSDLDPDELVRQMARDPRVRAARDFLLQAEGVSFTQPPAELRQVMEPLLLAVHGYEAAENVPAQLYELAFQTFEEYVEYASYAEKLAHRLRRLVERGDAAGLMGAWGEDGGLDTPETILADLETALRGEMGDYEAAPDQFARLAELLASDGFDTADVGDAETAAWQQEQAARARWIAERLHPVYQQVTALVRRPDPPGWMREQLQAVETHLASRGVLSALPEQAWSAAELRRRVGHIDDGLLQRHITAEQRLAVYGDPRVLELRKWLAQQAGFAARGSPQEMASAVVETLDEIYGSGDDENVALLLDRAADAAEELGFRYEAIAVGHVAAKLVALRRRAGAAGYLVGEIGQGGLDTPEILAADLWQTIRQDQDGDFVPTALRELARRVREAEVVDDFELAERTGWVANGLDAAADTLDSVYERLASSGGPLEEDK